MSYSSITELLKQRASEQLEQIMAANWGDLQAAAKEFLSWNQLYVDAKRQNQRRTTIASLNEISGYENYSSAMIKTAAVSKSFYRALFQFDKVLTKYLGEIPKRAIFTIVDTDGTPHTYEMSLEQLADISQGRGRVGDLNAAGLASIESLIDQESEDFQEHIAQGRSAAIGVHNRLKRFYEGRGMQTVKKHGQDITRRAQNQGGLLMWKTGGSWKIVRVANQGVVNEAYSNFLMTKHKSKEDYLAGVGRGEAPYYSHSLIEKFYSYLHTVTNQAAIVEEDIYTEWAQYAVKGRKAGLPSPQQYIRTAYTILSSSDEIAPKKLKQMITAEFSNESQLAPFIAEVAEENIGEEVKKLMNESGFDKANIQFFLGF